MNASGVIIHHPTTAPEALAAWQTLHTRLRQERPDYLLWSLGGDLDIVRAHIRAQPGEGSYRIIPLLMAPGKHLQEDIAHVVEALSAERPDIKLTQAPVLLEDPRFLEFWIAAL
mgnify:CR=1 FL=1